MARTTLMHERTFLNVGEGMAALEATVTDGSYTDKRTGERAVYLDSTLNLTDCSRSISLDFSVGDAESLKAALHKADRIIDAVKALRDAIAKAAKKEGIK